MTKSVPDTSSTEIIRLFDVLKSKQNQGPSVAKRKKGLKNLLKEVNDRKDQIRSAAYRDMKKPPREVDMTEIYPTVSELKHAIRHLPRWAAPEKVSTPLALLGSRSVIHKEPKGTVLIISPWNFPLNLTFGPLASALAAGNRVVLKPSEHTPNMSAVMKEIVETVFPSDEVVLVEGAIETSKTLLDLPFNHIFFTGSPVIGKLVMEAAAKNLSSVTLELGGKSPTIIDETANEHKAAERIAMAKFTNNGQICIAPDHVYIHRSKADSFSRHLQLAIGKMYGSEVINSPNYGRIVNENHHKRLETYVSHSDSSKIKMKGGHSKAEECFMEPTILYDVDENTDPMREEIFGPVLPVQPYDNLDTVLSRINNRERPLALYIFSKSKSNTRKIIEQTRAGGTCINHAAVHYYNNNLPFGGVNNSGIGKAKGKSGFDAFTNNRAILKQWAPYSAIDLIKPPYGSKIKDFLINFTVKYL